nr:MAG TPA: hypothetical protein [Caudoviricetes sp.]
MLIYGIFPASIFLFFPIIYYTFLKFWTSFGQVKFL